MKQGKALTRASNVGTTGALLFLPLASLAMACSSSGASGSGSDGGASSGSSSGGSGSSGGGSSSGAGGSSGAGSSSGGNGTDDGGLARDGSSFEAGKPGTAGGVNLRTAGSFAILAKTGISTVPKSAVTGDIGVSPAAASYITGFALAADATNVFATSPQVTGKIFASDFASPTPANLTAAIGDMQTAFTDAAGRAPNFTEVGAGNIGGMTLAPGVYRWGTAVLVPTDVTLAGSATDVWIFQIAQTLTVSSATRVSLTGGALPQNVYWEVAQGVDLGTTAHFEGIVMTQTTATLETGASINGRLLAQAAVNIAGSTVVQP